MSDISRKDAAQQEMARRLMARHHLIPYIMRFYPSYKAGWAHKVIAGRLEQFLDDVINKRSPRLMIWMPPQTGKSMMVSDYFPSWALGQYPELRFILSSYSSSLPIRFSRYVRERLKSQRHRTVFPESTIHKEIQSAEHWETTAGGAFRAVGVGGSVTGHSAEILLIDDPFKDFEEANSETIREIVHNWYPTTLRTRLQSGGGIININTRWHDDDLSGRQLRLDEENRKAGLPEEILENWDILSLPALAEEDEYVDSDFHLYHEPGPGRVRVRKVGEALHPERHTATEWLTRKAGATSQQWSALYQQKPVPDSGDFFAKEDFAYYNSPPALHDYPVYFAWDLAVGEKARNDYSVGLAGVLIPKGGVNTLYILEMFRKRVRDKSLVEAIVTMYMKYRYNAAELGIEYGQLFLAIERLLQEAFERQKVAPVMNKNLRPIQDKRLRATPAAGWMQNHRIYWPRHAPWLSTAEAELLRFDAGVHDDIVDSLAWLVRMVKDKPLVRPPAMSRRRDKTVEQLIEEYSRGQMDRDTGFMSA